MRHNSKIVIVNAQLTFAQADEFDEKCKYDWWSKYYASIEENERVQEGYLTDCHDKLKVSPINKELLLLIFVIVSKD